MCYEDLPIIPKQWKYTVAPDKKEQYEVLEEQRRQINATMERLKYKISRYQKAVETGVLSWEKEEEN